MRVELLETAAVELDDAIEYYNQQVNGLGLTFFDEVLKTIELISQYPQLWSRNTKNTRKAVLRKFPFNLIYSILDDKIYILAVAHQNRKPEYWIDRI